MRQMILCVVALCGLGCVKASRVDGLPEIPVAVSSRLGPVPIIWVDSLRDPTNGDALYGAFDLIQRRIYLTRALQAHRVSSWAVVYHEICHLRMVDSGIRSILPMAIQQAICDMFAAEQVSTLMGQRP